MQDDAAEQKALLGLPGVYNRLKILLEKVLFTLFLLIAFIYIHFLSVTDMKEISQAESEARMQQGQRAMAEAIRQNNPTASVC
jgi:hypothetical protein